MSNTTRNRRRYSDAEQAEALAALAANGGDTRATAAAMGIPEATIRSWARGARRPPSAQLCAEKKADLADRFEAVVHKMLDILDGDTTGIKPTQAAVIAGISTEKMLLLRGEATQIVTHQDDERVAELSRRYTKLHSEYMVVEATTAPAPQLPAATPPTEGS